MSRILLIAFFLSSQFIQAQVQGKKYYIGTSAFMMANLNQNNPEHPNFYQANFGYQISSKDVFSLEFITWRYYAPLGVKNASGETKIEDKFPGHVAAKGIALAYQRFIYGNWYTALHSAFMDQKYSNIESQQIGSGNQLFLTFRLGYHLEFLSHKLFLEPSIALTHWPINTNLPLSFQIQEDKWPKYQVEPGLHLGYIF
ncbi:MAG: hypothetical protein JNL11_00410 [Bdellovibrionaceae bacterium]|nr:hypothetical protein [Pseudobdellovibrionaceae bacterium]